MCWLNGAEGGWYHRGAEERWGDWSAKKNAGVRGTYLRVWIGVALLMWAGDVDVTPRLFSVVASLHWRSRMAASIGRAGGLGRSTQNWGGGGEVRLTYSDPRQKTVACTADFPSTGVEEVGEQAGAGVVKVSMVWGWEMGVRSKQTTWKKSGIQSEPGQQIWHNQIAYGTTPWAYSCARNWIPSIAAVPSPERNMIPIILV